MSQFSLDPPPPRRKTDKMFALTPKNKPVLHNNLVGSSCNSSRTGTKFSMDGIDEGGETYPSDQNDSISFRGEGEDRGGMEGSCRSPPSAYDHETSKNFKVVVRYRPPLPREAGEKGEFHNVVRKDGNRITISEHAEDGSSIDSSANADAHQFHFDHVFDHKSEQSQVYKHTAREAVLSTLEGYNATIFAYGQTGSGKTYTMEGFDTSELRGIIPRSIEEIFSYIQNTANSSARFLVRASYLQVCRSFSRALSFSLFRVFHTHIYTLLFFCSSW